MNDTSIHQIISTESPLGMTLSAGLTANMQVLQTSRPFLASLLGEKDLLQDGLLGRDEHSYYGIITPGAGGQSFLPLTDYENIALLQGKLTPLFQQYDTIIFMGTGIGEFLSSTIDSISRFPQEEHLKRRYIFIEPTVELIQAVLYFFDFTPLWLSSNISFCIGPTWKKQLDTLLLHDPIETRMLFAIHPVADENQARSAIDVMQKHLSEPQVKMWEIEGQQVVFAGPKGDPTIRITFDNNLKVLKETIHLHCHPDTINRIGLESISFRKDKAEAISIGIENNQRLKLTLNEQELQFIKNFIDEKNNVFDTYLVLGAGDVMLLKTVLEKTFYNGQWNGFEQVVYLVEPSVEYFVILMHLLDITGYIKKNRLRIFVGPTALSDFSLYLETQEFARIPNHFFACHYFWQSGLLNKLKSDCTKLQLQILIDTGEISSELSSYYESLPLSHWKNLFSNTSQLTVVGISSTATSFLQYCTRDLLNGFAQHGHRTSLLIEPDGTSTLRRSWMASKLNLLKPDLIIVIDHLRDEFTWIPKKIPYICWIQDPLPNIINNQGYKLQDFDFTYTLIKSWENALQKNSTFDRVKINELPIACNEQIYHKIEGKTKKYDICYIANLYEINNTFFPFASHASSLPLNGDERRMINEKKITEELLLSTYSILQRELNILKLSELTEFITHPNPEHRQMLICALLTKNSIPVNNSLVDSLVKEISRLEWHIGFLLKSKPIRHLLGNGIQVSVWGNNWDSMPEFANVAQGVAKNGSMINAIQNESKICLHNSPGLSFHMRALEILASGNFMLSLRNKYDFSPIADYLVEGEEVILFNDEQDLLKKVEYYLSHEDEREMIAQKAMKKTIANYSYYNTAERLVQDIKNRIQALKS